MILKESLSYKYNTEVEAAYIITLKGHDLSETMYQKCQESCKEVGMNYVVYDAFDGTKGEILIPEHSKGRQYLKWIKQINPALAVTEVSVVLSHLSLWARCVEIDQPIVILEHDAVMVQPYIHHNAINNIVYLGSIEQVENKYWGLVPIHGQLNPNYRFMLRAHAYAIDPMIARQLLTHVIKFGIVTIIDVLLRIDVFPIVQHGIFAVDMAGESTSPEKTEKYNDPHMMKVNNRCL